MKKNNKRRSKQPPKKTSIKKVVSQKEKAAAPSFEEACLEALGHEGAGRWAEAVEAWTRGGEAATNRVDRIKAAGAAAAAKVRADAKATSLDEALDSNLEPESEVQFDDAAPGEEDPEPATATAEAEDAIGTADGELNEGPEDASDAELSAPRIGIDPRLPPLGTVIVKRDRHGVERARCEMVDGGVDYRGTVYRSISAAALAAAKDLGLAGKTQDGFAFWKLKKAPPRRDAESTAEALAKAWERYRERAADSLKTASNGEAPIALATIHHHIDELKQMVTASN